MKIMNLKRNKIYIYLFLLVCATIFLGIGYAQISGIDLSVSGDASLEGQTGIFINNVSYSNSNNANEELSKINTYYGTTLNTEIVLNNNITSSITYEVTIYNASDKTQKYTGVVYDENFYDNSDITYEVNNLSIGDSLQSNHSVTFTITYKYIDNLENITNITLNSYLNFSFEDQTFTITYIDFTGDTSNLLSIIPDTGGTIVFNNTTGIPSNISVIGANYNYENPPTLLLTNVTANVTITALPESGGSGTANDPYINYANTYTTNNLETGITTFPNVAGEPQVTVDESGNITNFEFTSTESITYESGETLDTGIIAFNGSAFTINLTFQSDLSANAGKYIVSALEKDEDDLYSGFAIQAVSTTSIRIATFNKVANVNGSLTASSTATVSNLTVTDNTYKLVVKYDKEGYESSSVYYALLKITVGGKTTSLKNSSSSSTRVPTSLDNASITLAGNGLNSNNSLDMTVTKFSVEKS